MTNRDCSLASEMGVPRRSGRLLGALCCALLTLVLGSSVLTARAELLLLCGAGEVFEIDVAKPLEKRWSWRAQTREELPPELRGAFATTDDCKPLADGKRVLISASSGGCALVERPSGRPVWWARVANAHSIEMLPRERIVVASSVGAQGNKLVLFDVARPDERRWETELKSAHGVIWDAARERLWALGFTELRCYALKDWESENPSLTLEASYPLPDEDGHDLQPVPGGNDLAISMNSQVALFDRETHVFRPHPTLAAAAGVKCVTIHPTSGRMLVVNAEDGHWWSTRLQLIQPAAEILLPTERLYKGRWLAE